jgi:hypothetical protein
MNMFRSLLLAVLMSALFAASTNAVGLTVAKNLVFTLDPVDGWTVHSADPPEALVKETARHLAHEPAAANATPEQIEIVARKRLAANEAIVYHASSGAHLDIDFSPLDEGASAPNSGTLNSSAEYAARSLVKESDVTDAVWDVRAVKFDGAEDTSLLSVKFLKHGAPMVFRGYIGTVARYWFFLYFTAPGDNQQVLQEMESMLAKASIRIVEP